MPENRLVIRRARPWDGKNGAPASAGNSWIIFEHAFRHAEACKGIYDPSGGVNQLSCSLHIHIKRVVRGGGKISQYDDEYS